MPERRKNFPIITGWLLLPALTISNLLSPVVAANSNTTIMMDSPVVSRDSRARLLQIEKQRQELHNHAALLRKQEQIALVQLSHIQTKLNKTNTVLHVHEHNMQKTESVIKQTEIKINKTQSAEEILSESAAKRLREIFEGNRVSLLEQMMTVDSLQSLLDRFYFQERIAEMDRNLLQDLRAKTAQLVNKKGQLGEQRDKLGNLVSEFAQKAMAFAREKLEQQQVAERLKTQRAFYEKAEHQLASESHRLETAIMQMESSHRKSNKNMATGSGSLAMPLNAAVTSPFGWRRHPIFGVRKFHTGVDLAGPNHSAIRAADNGNVLYTGWYGGYGKVVIISHGKGMATLYAHMSKADVSVGQNVSKGDVIGHEGTTGFSTGPHLHFEVRVDGKPNNPMNYLR